MRLPRWHWLAWAALALMVIIVAVLAILLINGREVNWWTYAFAFAATFLNFITTSRDDF